MDAIKKLMNLLESKSNQHDWESMILILKDSHQYFQNIPASERGMILNVLFNDKNGIILFLRNAIEHLQANKKLDGVITEMFTILIFVMTNFVDVYSPHLSATQAVCKLALFMKLAHYPKLAAAKALLVLIRTFASYPLDFDETIEEFVQKFKYWTPNERRMAYEVIAAISKYFPQSPAWARYAKPIRVQLLAEMVREGKNSKNRSVGIVTYVETLDNLLQNFPPSNDEIGKSGGPDEIYERLKTFCAPSAYEHNKPLKLALINLLSHHLNIFDNFVYADYKFWHNLLKSYITSNLYGDSAVKALRFFYKTMGSVLASKNSDDDKQIFLNLKCSFEKSLSHPNPSSTQLRTVVFGFSQLIQPCKEYFNESGVEEMFSLIAQRVIPRYAREDDESARLEEIADYQEALSLIIRYMPNATIHQIRALTALCSLLIKRYPELSTAHQEYATISLNRTIVNVSYTNANLYQDFISHIIYDGIVWSCSHTLLIDAELIREEEKILDRTFTYKDYVSLWQGLLNPENYNSSTASSEIRVAALQKVVDEVMTTCIVLLNTLNINVKSLDNNIFTEPTISQVPENEADFRIFLNLVDLNIEVLSTIENYLWSNNLDKFLYEIIKNSYKNPLISGFYKLAKIVLITSGSFDSAGHQNENDDTFNLVLRYLLNALESVSQLPLELQISCLRLILNVPEKFISRIADRAIPAFKISFSIGLTNYEIATVALSALEKWVECLDNERSKKFVSQLVPSLEKYLHGKKSSGILRDIKEVKKTKQVTLLDDELSMENIQKKILLFFGSLDIGVMLNFINDNSLKTGATWNRKNVLKYTIPFPDIHLDINLDILLPRIVELALNSGDRETRVTASEVLHSILAILLGKMGNQSYRSCYETIYEFLCPALLRLGCDNDDVIHQIFHPTILQTTHWLTSQAMLNSGATVSLVNSIFQGLCDQTNSSLREICGIYLAEFVRWSIKQSTDSDLANSPVNINLIVKRIIYFALDPSVNKRVAAAIAFNNLYTIFRENEIIVDYFWLEMLHSFVKSLEGCDDSRIDDALKHIERVCLEKSQIFNNDNSKRNVPVEFTNGQMKSAVQWIFQQCGSNDRNCRKKCIKLFESLSRVVEGSGTPRSIVDDYLEREGIATLDRIVIGDLEKIFQPTCDEGFESLLKTLDLYVWLLREKLVDDEILFSPSNESTRVVLRAIKKFVGFFIFENSTVNNVALRPQEFVRLMTLKCGIVLTICDFFPLMLDAQSDNFLPEIEFYESIFHLVSACVVEPQKIGFDSSNPQLTEELPVKLENLLQHAKHKLTEPLMTSLKNVFAGDIQRFSSKLFKFSEIISNEISLNEKSIKGLILLHKCELLKACTGCTDITSGTNIKINQIFDSLSTEEMEKKICFDLSLEVRIYFERLLELLLLKYDMETMKIVLKLVTNTDKLFKSDLTTRTTRGEYFFSLFKDVLIRGFLNDIENTLNLLEISLKNNPDDTLRITESMVLYLQRNRGHYHSILDKSADLLMSKFSVFERTVNNFEYRRNVFLNIYAIVVRLKKNPLLTERGEFYQWILKELVECNKLKYKIRLLRDFLICLTEENSEDYTELTIIMYALKNERRIAELSLVDKIPEPETIDCFHTLLRLLPITKSSIVFDAVVNFAQGAGKILCDSKVSEYLELYFGSISAQSVLKSLESAYKRFMNANDINERFDALSYFLLPSFARCCPQTMEKFFERNIHEICTIIMQMPTEIVKDRRQLIVAKIGCYNLLEIMFAKLPKDRIDCKESLITNKTIHRSNTDEKFSKLIFRSTLSIRQLQKIEGEDTELFRRMQCAAYNCSIAIVSMTSDERFYVTVFGENRAKNQLIWENIVDVNRRYELRQTFDKYPKMRKKIVNIRKSEREKQKSVNYSYVKSYDLASSTLKDNIAAYDLNTTNLLAKIDSSSNETMELTLEVDDLNDHECMTPICGLLTHIMNSAETPLDSGKIGNSSRPKWTTHFRNSMFSVHPNVRLFMLKIVVNTQPVFKPYADFFVEPIVDTINQFLKVSPLSYVITDALVMLVDWRNIYVPTTDRDKEIARSMLNSLLEKGTAAPTKHIVRYNLSIIESIVDAWHDSLQFPNDLKIKMSTNDRLAVRLILIFLTNHMEDRIIRDDVWEYLEKSLENWKIEEETVLQSYEAIGLMLKYSATNGDRWRKIVDIANTSFRAMQIPNPERLVKCVHALCKACPDLTVEFFNFVSSSYPRVQHSHMAKCLEIFSLVIPKIRVEKIIIELDYMQFRSLLENKVLSCEKICLSIIEQLVTIIEPKNLLPFVRLLSDYCNHDRLDYRKVCYETAKKCYDKYSLDVSQEQLEIVEILEMSRKILLSGLVDPAEEMQSIATVFWSTASQVSDKCSERLLDILGTYTSGVEKNFLQIMTVMLLQLTKKSINYETKLCEPLPNCRYYEHEISVSRKTRNYESRVPLFAPSRASKLTNRLTQYSCTVGASTSRSCSENSENDILLRATQTPEFEATFVGESVSKKLPNISEDRIFAIPKVPEIAKNKVSRRFLANWSAKNVTVQKRETSRKFTDDEYREEYEARQRSSVKLYRKYKIGDFPDVAISHATFLLPMQELMKKDPEICKNFIVTLIRALVDRKTDDRFCHILSDKLIDILKKRKRNSAVNSAIFEILFSVPEIEYPWEIVTEVARLDGLFAQGAILTELGIIDEKEAAEPPAKKPRRENRYENNERWIELANLYESMDEVDIVLSIFRRDIFSEELRVASAARAVDDWEKAEKSYRAAFEMETNTLIKQHCLQGTFECMRQLSNWSKLEKDISLKVNSDFETLLDDEDPHNQRWALSWIFCAHTQLFLEGSPNKVFEDFIKSYLEDATKSQRLKELFGEETAVVLINQAPEISRDFLNGSCERSRVEWIGSSPLAVSLRSAAIVKLQTIHDTDCYLKTVDSADIAESTRSLANSWLNRGNSYHDLVSWDKQLSYRSHFIDCLIEKFDADSQEGSEIVDLLRLVRVKQILKLADCALIRKNIRVAKKYLGNIESEVEKFTDQDVTDTYELSVVRYNFLKAKNFENSAKSIKYYAASWEASHKILRGVNHTDQSQILVRQIITNMALHFADLSLQQGAFIESLTAESSIIQDIFTERIDLEKTTDYLCDYSFRNLKECCTISADIGACHLRLAKFCYERIIMGSADSSVTHEFVRSTLKAMSCGSDEATHYFPCLLRDEILGNDETRKTFTMESDKVEPWRFLIWQVQLLSHLGTLIGNLVLPIIHKIINIYPNALIYSLKLTLDTKPALRDDPSILLLIDLLGDKNEFNRFLEALEYVVQPELYLEYHLRELVRHLPRGKSTVIDELMKKVYPKGATSGKSHSIQGDIYIKSIAVYKREIESFIDLSEEEIVKRADDLQYRLLTSLNKRQRKNQLENYSPWLQKFEGREIEIPGQYSGDKKPLPRYHAKIVKLESTVKLMQSKRKPIRITLVANNAKSYRFLVKFGEDLRLDQRIEQIFHVMNKTLKADNACFSRRLSIDTYQVFPLSGSLGFLQWVDGTKTLSDYVHFTSKKLTSITEAMNEYNEWIAKAAPGKNKSIQYKEALLKYKSSEVIGKMIYFREKIPWDMFRKTFVLLSPSMESFVSLRRNFTTSYATMCVAQWILGVGDRHLSNTLVSIESGKSLGIDFGSAFGSAIDQSVPELVPFRLTAQIQGLLKPFNEYDLMGATMTHVLRALRNGKDPLLACMNVVAHEQLNWEEHVNQLSQEIHKESVDITWLPMKKLAVVAKKLNGENSSSVTLEQLAERHYDDAYFHRYRDIVNGTDSVDGQSKRSLMRENNLSPEEQVECLIEQATDLNVLGRTYSGWTPWI